MQNCWIRKIMCKNGNFNPLKDNLCDLQGTEPE